jgi:hypothetical protein
MIRKRGKKEKIEKPCSELSRGNEKRDVVGSNKRLCHGSDGGME